MYRTLISTDTLTDILATNFQDNEWVIFDCRSDPDREHYLQAHIPKAQWVDLDIHLSSPPTTESGGHPLPNPEAFEQNLRTWGVSEHTQVVVYDDVSGAMAGRMWWMLRWIGHNQVAVLDGGFKKWKKENRRLSQGEEPLIPLGNITVQAVNELWVSTKELELLIGKEDVVVIDSRSAKRYRGEEEELDKEGGHIPTALNRPLTDNLDSNGCFLSAETLAQAFNQLRKPVTIHSCESGVTACHNCLAMEIAGISDSRLYVGSWSEWIQMPHRKRVQGSEPGEIQ